jgi:hypothetical protein
MLSMSVEGTSSHDPIASPFRPTLELRSEPKKSPICNNTSPAADPSEPKEPKLPEPARLCYNFGL